MQRKKNVPIRGICTMISMVFFFSSLAQGAWSGYGIYRGETTSVAEDPSDADVFFVGTRNAGVFRSADAGATWLPRRQGLPATEVSSLALDPESSSKVLAGTDGAGIWRSTNGGGSWSPCGGVELGMKVRSIVHDPVDSDVVYAGVSSYSAGNVYRSTNGGVSWVVSDDGMPGSAGSHTDDVLALALDPDTTTTLYAATSSYGVYRSTNGGTLWSGLTSGLPNDGSSFEQVTALAVNPHDDKPWAVVPGFYEGLYRLDDTDTWVRVSLDFELTGGEHLDFSPTSATTLFASGGIGGSADKSTDGGATWSRSLGHPDSGSVAEIAFHPAFPSVLVAAASMAMGTQVGGVYRSTDEGVSWSLSTQGVTAADLRSVAVDPGNALHIYAGTAGGALLHSHDGGTTWARAYESLSPTSFSFGFDTDDVAVDPGNGQWVYLAAQSLWASNDGGVSFNVITEGDWAQCLAIAPGATSTVFAGRSFGGGILRGSSSGPWVEVNNGLPVCGLDMICTVSSLAVAPLNPLIVWAGTQGGGIVRSVDGGDTWSVTGLATETQVNAVAVSPGSSQVVLVGASERIYKSTNGGGSWIQKHVATDTIEDLVFHPHEPLWVYAATDGGGVLRSIDGGESWHTFSSGIFSPAVMALAVSRDASPRLLAATDGSGLYWQDLPMAPTIFLDGFESGDVNRWSNPAP